MKKHERILPPTPRITVQESFDTGARMAMLTMECQQQNPEADWMEISAYILKNLEEPLNTFFRAYLNGELHGLRAEDDDPGLRIRPPQEYRKPLN